MVLDSLGSDGYAIPWKPVQCSACGKGCLIGGQAAQVSSQSSKILVDHGRRINQLRSMALLLFLVIFGLHYTGTTNIRANEFRQTNIKCSGAHHLTKLQRL
jgi:hypothetical protein